MFILCSGPDSYRAVTKAQDLERAFKEKFDKSGTSVEHLDIRDGLEELAKRIETISLFSPKRFIRMDGLVEVVAKKKDQLLKTLAKNSEDAIIVSVEEESQDVRLLESFKALPKFVHYPFPTQNVAQFEAWVEAKAQECGVTDRNQIRQIVIACYPDSWFASTELLKAAAGNHEAIQVEETKNPYSWAEDVLLDPKKQSELLSESQDEDVLSSLLSAARLLSKIKDGQTQGIHPVAVQKLKYRANSANPEAQIASLSSSLLLQRAGYGTDEELLSSGL